MSVKKLTSSKSLATQPVAKKTKQPALQVKKPLPEQPVAEQAVTHTPEAAPVASAEPVQQLAVAGNLAVADAPVATAASAAQASEISTGWLLGGVALLGGIAAAAGGGGGGGSSSNGGGNATVSKVSGVAIDGYITGGTVWLVDSNGKRIDTGVKTDANGRFTIENPKGYAIVVTGGTNQNGVENKLELRAPAGSASGNVVVTPLTTLMAELVDQGKTLAQAEILVEKLFGIDTKIELLKEDPIAGKQFEAQLGGIKLATVLQTLEQNKVASGQQKLIEELAATLKLSDGGATDLNTILMDALKKAALSTPTSADKLIAEISKDLNTLDAVKDLGKLDQAQKDALSNNDNLLSPGDTTKPVFTSGTGAEAAENQNVLYIAKATDETSAVTYSLTGTDAALLQIAADGKVTLKSGKLDFEGSKASYTFTVVGTDASGNKAEQSVTVNVTNVNEAPTEITLSANTIAENVVVGSGVEVGVLTVVDPDATGNSNVLTLEGADAASFKIEGGKLIFIGESPDFESGKQSYSVTVKSTDGALVKSETFTVNVKNFNEVPTAITLSTNEIAENVVVGSGVEVGVLTVLDPDASGNSNVLTLEGADAASFKIENGKLLFIGASPDFEAKTSYSVTVKSTDGALVKSESFTVNVKNVNEVPTAITLLTNEIAENVVVGSGVEVGVLAVTDPDATGNSNVLTLEGADKDLFKIENGKLLFIGTSPDFESGKQSYSVTVKSTDGALVKSESFTVNVTDVDETSPGAPSSGDKSGYSKESATLTVYFNEALDEAAEAIDLSKITLKVDRDGAGPLAAETISLEEYATVSVDSDNPKALVISFLSGLPQGTFTVELAEGAVKDAAGNPSTARSEAIDPTEGADLIAPAVLQDAAATSWSKGSQTITVHFSEKLVVGEAMALNELIMVKKGETAFGAGDIQVDLGLDEQSLVITFLAEESFPVDGNISITLPEGVVQDVAGNLNANHELTLSTLPPVLDQKAITASSGLNTVETNALALELTINADSSDATVGITANEDNTTLTLLGGVDNTTITLELDGFVTAVDASELKGSLVAGLDVSVSGGELLGTGQADTLISHGGGNLLLGGEGSDTFKLDFTLAAAPASTDRIDDFTIDVDKIDVSKLLGGATLAGGDSWLAASAETMGAQASFYTGANAEGDTILYYDADGSGMGEAKAVVTFALGLNEPLTTNDFKLV